MKRVLLPLLLLSVFALGVGSAGGRTLATTTITVEVIGKGAVKSSDSKVKCGNGDKTCYLAFSGGETITLTHKAASGWDFVSWAGACVSDPCTVTMTGADKLVTATFTKPSGAGTSTLSVASTGSGEVSSPGGEIACGMTGTTCTWDVLTGSTLTIFETPDPGNLFSGWGGACSGTGVSCTVEMGGNKTVSATWVDASATKLLTITVKGAGEVKGAGISCSGPGTCSVNEPLNSTIVLTANPDDGFAFTGWSGGGCDGTGATCSITMDAAKSITATFAPVLSVSVTGNGSVSAGAGAINCGNGASICSASFAQNSTVTLVATPSTGATFIGWGGACGGTATTCAVLMSTAKDVSATFTGGTGGTTGFTLSVSVTGNGTVTGGGINCGGGGTVCSSPNHASGSTVTLTAIPSGGATFGGWGGACTGTVTTCAVVMTSAKSVTATFLGGTATFRLSVSVSGAGTVTGGGINCGNGALI